MTSKNSNLHAAKKARNDEFYTRLCDIENEVQHYRPHFAGKTVYLNCDDPRESQFFRYFSLNFEDLGLKRLIATSYAGGVNGEAVFFEYLGDQDGSGVPDPDEIDVTPLKGDGDFRSEESLALLAEADIVVSNPPFSLFREYVAQLIEHDKKFLIIGNRNALTYKEIFPLIHRGEVWLGHKSGSMEFEVPASSPAKSAKERDGVKYQKLRSVPVSWFTNLDHRKRREDLILTKKYDPALYPTYDNYDAIEVSRVANIPLDYDGVMGVPITFLDKWNPEQFEIVGITDRGDLYGLKTEVYDPESTPKAGDLNRRAAIKRADGTLTSTYARILIRRKGTCAA